MLYLGSELDPRGLVRYSYSILPGVVTVLTTLPGPTMPAPDDPLVITEVQRIARDYTAHA